MTHCCATLVALLALVGVAQAQQTRTCADGLVTDEPSASRPGVIGNAIKRLHFYSGLEAGPDCPTAGEKCRLKSYVVPGDKVVLAPQTVQGFVCVAFVDRKGAAHVGWVAVAAVTPAPPRDLALGDWLGEWRDGNSTITITRDKTPGRIVLDGSSFTKRLSAMTNVGNFAATVVPTGHAISFADRAGETLPIEKAEEYDCVIKLARLHDLMIVNASSACGGVGVDFSGYYRRKR